MFMCRYTRNRWKVAGIIDICLPVLIHVVGVCNPGYPQVEEPCPVAESSESSMFYTILGSWELMPLIVE